MLYSSKLESLALYAYTSKLALNLSLPPEEKATFWAIYQEVALELWSQLAKLRFSSVKEMTGQKKQYTD